MATKAASKKTTTSKKSAKTTKTTRSTSAKTASRKTNTTSGKTNSKASSVKTEPVVRRAKSVSLMAIMESLIIGVLGVLLIVRPNEMVKIIFYAVGIFLIIKGVYKILNYFAVHGKYDFYNNDLLYGIVALVFGIVAVILWEQLGQVIGIVVGAWMIYGALVRMNAAIKMHTAGIKEWFYVLLLAMIMLALGIYMVISVGAVLAIVGWVMVAAAIIGILDDVIFIRHLDTVA